MRGGREPGMSAPVSATMTCATFFPTPGMVCNNSIWCGHGRQRLGDDRVQLGQSLLDQLQPPQHRLGQLGMVSLEGSSQRLRQVRILRRICLSRFASCIGSPSIIAVSIARADTVFKLDADRGQFDGGVFQHQLQPDRSPGSDRPISCIR